jgi:protein-S-isoprenylcysteine O-methyltransferase Ste14
LNDPDSLNIAMTMQNILTVLLLTGTGLFLYFYHVRTKRFGTEGRKQVTSFRWYEIVDWYLKISSLMITLAAIHWQQPLLLQFHDQMGLRFVGMGLAAIAIALFVWAMSTLGRHYTPAHLSHLPLKLVGTGPYRIIRHPVYTSNLLLMVALLLVSGSWWMLLNLVILITYYVPTIVLEERSLCGEFPEYREYARRTGRFFPRLPTGLDHSDERSS